MPEFAFSIATKEFDCPKCKSTQGNPCRSPAGRIRTTPHGERVKQLKTEHWERCRGKAFSTIELLSKLS